jgi:hypothetical protein
MPRRIAWILAVLQVALSWSLAMARDDVPRSLMATLFGGPQLPWLTVLGKMGGQYVELLGDRRPDPILLLALAGALLALLWWPFERAAQRRA